MKLLIVGPANLGPYHFARFRALEAAGAQVQYLACHVSEHARPWADDLSASARARFVVGEVGRRWPLKTSKALRRAIQFQPDVAVVVGYGQGVVEDVARFMRLSSVPTALWLIGTPLPSEQIKSWRSRLKSKRSNRHRFAIVPGIKAAELGIQLGLAQSSISIVGHAVDDDHFGPTEPPSEARNDLDQTTAFVYVGRLSEEKGLFALIDAFRAYRMESGQWHLHIYGTGPLETALAAYSTDLESVSLRGWATYDELPAIYSKAGCVVLPSLSEPWGLVVNEALLCGTPVIASDAVGSVPELLSTVRTGRSFTVGDTSQLVSELENIEAWVDTGRIDAKECRETALTMSLDNWSVNFLAAVEQQLNRHDDLI